MPASKHRVFMLVPTFYPLPMGGSEKQAKLLAKHLVTAGAEISVVTVGNNELPVFEVIDGIRVFRVFSLSKGIERKNKSPFPEIDKFSAQEKIFGKVPGFRELMHSLFLFAKVFFVFYKRRKEYAIIHVHTIELIAFTAVLIGLVLNKKVLVKDSTMNGLIKIGLLPVFGKPIQRLIARRSYFIAMTKRIEENYLYGGVRKERIFRISNCVEVPPESYFKEENDYIATFVGNLYQQPAKGIDVLLKAWVNVVSGYPRAILKIVGNGDIQAYMDFAKGLGIEKNIQLLGQLSDIKSVLLQSDLFVLPSRREGMSNALMEAMALGVPCIATRISGAEDLIVDGECGILVDPDDYEALATSIMRMFGDKKMAIEFGGEARKRIINMCLPKAIAEKYQQVYSNIIGS